MRIQKRQSKDVVSSSTKLILVIFGIFVAGCSTTSKQENMAPEEVATQYIQELYSSNYAKATEKYLAKNYIEHQPSAAFSRVGLESYVEQRISANPSHQLIIHRVIAQGERVFLHMEERLNNEETYARAEMFRVSDGKIVEHWATAQKVPKGKNDYMFGGAAVNNESTAGVKYTPMMKTAYRGFIGDVDIEVAKKYVADEYFQHNPMIEPGKDALLGFVRLLKEKVTYRKLTFHGTVASGDFTVLHVYADYPPLFTNVHIFDIFRVTEDGQLAEHWDIIENIKPEIDIEKVF
ncbi:MAG: hypothetical protein DRQ47_10035 [Gammaproteobacteria bacterium]|nr:MAG: hypothetical protein DRQ47_10035 [Gammaproteobacteria bacterium]